MREQRLFLSLNDDNGYHLLSTYCVVGSVLCFYNVSFNFTKEM